MLLRLEKLGGLGDRLRLDPHDRGVPSTARRYRVDGGDVDFGARQLAEDAGHRADAVVAAHEEAGLSFRQFEAEALRRTPELRRILGNEVELRLLAAREAGKGEQIDALRREAGQDFRALARCVWHH